VTARDEGGSGVIYVLPANPETIYVPVYDPGIVFSSFASGAIAFGVGVLVGSAWNNRWGWNNRSWNQIWVTPPAWHPPPPTWRPPHPGRRGAGHRDPGDQIGPAAGRSVLAAGRSVPAGLVVVPKFRMLGRSVLVVDPKPRTFGRSVLAGLGVVPKFRTFGRSALVADPKARTFGRSVRAGPAVVPKLRVFGRSVLVADPKARALGLNGPAVVPKSQAFGLKGLRPVPRVQVVERVLGLHNDPAMPLAPVADIVTRLDGLRRIMLRGHISRRDNNRSTRRGLGRPRPGVPGRSRRDKVTRGSAIALRGEGDLGSSENARCAMLASGEGCSHREVAHARLHYLRHGRGVRSHRSRISPGRLTSQK
jgi:hypothetical protein